MLVSQLSKGPDTTKTIYVDGSTSAVQQQTDKKTMLFLAKGGCQPPLSPTFGMWAGLAQSSKN